MSTHQISLTVDGQDRSLTVEGRTLLVHALRDTLDITSPKIGCDTSKCGACTVELDDEIVKSCTVLAVQADGKSIQTVADRSDTSIRETVKNAFHDHHAIQCGYCTSGMIISVSDFLETNPNPSRDEITRALKGNICRCTGYVNIIRAVEAASRQLSEPPEHELSQSGVGE